MAEAIKEGRAHKKSFEAFTAGLTAAMPEAVEEWRVWVEAWEKTRHVEKEGNSPYEYTEASKSTLVCDGRRLICCLLQKLLSRTYD